MSVRALILGTTGVNKDTALGNFKRYRETQYGEVNFEHLNLEKIILEKNGIKIFDYLDADEDEQISYWLKGWSELKQRLNHYTDIDLLLSMHAVLVRRSYGTRSPVKIKRIVEDFKPTIIITLIDDVHIKWYWTHNRAAQRKQKYLGKPTLEQLLQARRSEILIGDLITKQITDDSPYPPHYVISVWHPARVLDRIIFRKPLTTAYLSFPISKPRKLKLAGDPSGENEINGILKRVSDFESKEHNIALFCPLTIDEYPLLKLLDDPVVKAYDEEIGEEKDFRVFQMENRWNIRDFYGRETLLLTDDSKLQGEIKIPIIDKVDEVSDVGGMIRTDVGIRDYRMIRQSNCMAVFDPVFKTAAGEFKFARGVLNEIEYAQKLKRKIPIYIYQNKSFDPDNLVSKRFETGSEHVGGQTYGSEYITLYFDLERLLQAIATIANSEK
ncbi:MAG: hypothetical protein DDT23_01013 [candidate division WS2 bacterium]|nr:hypothetical protein [Candidatus Lithacetigena glycinireducens]